MKQTATAARFFSGLAFVSIAPRATQLAAAVKDVTSVDNRLTVMPDKI